MKNPLLVPEFRELLAANNIEEIIDFCETTQPSVAADFLGALSAKENRNILLKLPSPLRGQIFSHFDDDVKLSIMSLLDSDDVIDLIASMLDEERLNFLKFLPAGKLREMRDLARRSSLPAAVECADIIDGILKAEEPEDERKSAEEIAAEIIPLLSIYKIEKGRIIKTDKIEPNCWINIVNPSRDDLPLFASHFRVPLDFLTASLDADETARIETEEGSTLIIIKVPLFDEHSPDLLYVTLPIGIILLPNMIVTICARETIILNDFIEAKVKHCTTVTGVRFLLQIIMRATTIYLQYLQHINNAASIIQARLEQESKNEQLIKLMNLEKSLVYFTTSLKTNALMLERLQRMSIAHFDDELENLFEDIVIDTKQALEMAQIYSDILSSMMDAFASVISNNLNITMKLLTSITIILMIPNIVTSFFGMNVKLPFSEHPLAYLIIIALSFVLSAFFIWLFVKKKWL